MSKSIDKTGLAKIPTELSPRYPNLHISPKKYQSGFTLVELMIVIAIVAILASLAGPSLTEQMGKQRIKVAERTILNAYKQARSEAMIQRRNIKVHFNRDGKQEYLELIPDNETTAIARYDFPASTRLALSVTGSSGLSISDSTDTFVKPYGTLYLVDDPTIHTIAYYVCDAALTDNPISKVDFNNRSVATIVKENNNCSVQ